MENMKGKKVATLKVDIYEEGEEKSTDIHINEILKHYDGNIAETNAVVMGCISNMVEMLAVNMCITPRDVLKILIDHAPADDLLK